jgi:hypothetical protein
VTQLPQPEHASESVYPVHRCRDQFYDWFELWSDGEVWLSLGRNRWLAGTTQFSEDGTAQAIKWTDWGVLEPDYRRERWQSWTWPGRKRLNDQGTAGVTVPPS